MKSDLSRSAASSASLRSRSALSMRKRSVTSAKVTRVAPSGSGDRPSDRMVRSLRSTSPRSRAWRRLPETIAWISRSHIAPSPNLRGAERRDGAHMRLAAQFLRLQIPDAGEGGVVQLEPAVGTEHRHAFHQRVEGGGLHLDQGVVVGFQRQLFADIFIKEGEAAKGMRLADHPHGLAAGDVPKLFRRAVARGLIQRQAPALPGLIVALFRQLARLRAAGRGFRRRWDGGPASLPESPTDFGEGAIVESSASGPCRRSPPRLPACPACRHGHRHAAAAGLPPPPHR